MIFNAIKSTDLTENEKREINKEIEKIVDLIYQNLMKYKTQK